MSEDKPRGAGPRQVGGGTTFRTAHAIADDPDGLPFEQAWALAQLALDFGGGPSRTPASVLCSASRSPWL